MRDLPHLCVGADVARDNDLKYLNNTPKIAHVQKDDCSVPCRGIASEKSCTHTPHAVHTSSTTDAATSLRPILVF